jgi:hypothetical protein
LGDRTIPVFRYVQYAEVATILGNNIDTMWDGKKPEDVWDTIEKQIADAGIGV